MKAVVLATNNFEDSELFYPYYRLEEEGIEVELATPDREDIVGKHGTEFEADLRIRGAETDEYDLVVIPGGKSPENLRVDSPEAVEFIREFDALGKPIAAICHGPQLLISANAVDGSSATCYQSIRVDLENSGANIRDESVVVDGNIITSRTPEDLPDFMRETIKKLNKKVG